MSIPNIINAQTSLIPSKIMRIHIRIQHNNILIHVPAYTMKICSLTCLYNREKNYDIHISLYVHACMDITDIQIMIYVCMYILITNISTINYIEICIRP